MIRCSTISLKILAIRECGIIKSNTQFWNEYSDEEKINRLVKDDPNISIKMKKISDSLNTLDYDCGVICIYDKEFPVINKNVKNKKEKPYLLFYRGNLSLLDNLNNNVAVVGHTQPDVDIVNRETNVIKKLVANNQTIVSGLAKGCDTIAHSVCLKCGGNTIAILSTSLNKIYPAKNKDLAESIVSSNGLLITEYFKEAASKTESINRFIERDRLQAMFSKSIILTASYRKGEGDSGSRHAMEAAKKYGIDRYVMYNEKKDKHNNQFGLNYDLAKTDKAIQILKPSSINYISNHYNPNLSKLNQCLEVQESMDLDNITNKVHIFDLDNTLVDTDYLNNISYNYALNIFGMPPIDNCKRITKDIVFNTYPNLSDENKEGICKMKLDYFIQNMQHTIINKSLFGILHSLDMNDCILWTSADKNRVSAILEYYQISDCFKVIKFSDKKNIISDANEICTLFRCKGHDLLFYENDLELVNKIKKLNFDIYTK